MVLELLTALYLEKVWKRFYNNVRKYIISKRIYMDKKKQIYKSKIMNIKCNQIAIH